MKKLLLIVILASTLSAKDKKLKLLENLFKSHIELREANARDLKALKEFGDYCESLGKVSGSPDGIVPDCMTKATPPPTPPMPSAPSTPPPSASAPNQPNK